MLNITHGILVVDSDQNQVLALSEILKKAGIKALTAGSAEEARQLLRQGSFDLVIIDLRLPDCSGLDLLREVRKSTPALPVIMITAVATRESAMEALRCGAVDYMLKPLEAEAILEKAEAALKKKNRGERRKEIIDRIQLLLTELYASGPGAGALVESLNLVDPARILQAGPFMVDLDTRKIFFEGENLNISPTAFEYLVCLIRHSPEIVSYETLVSEAQGFSASLQEAQELCRWRIHEIRKLIEPDLHAPRYILTTRRKGYRLVVREKGR